MPISRALAAAHVQSESTRLKAHKQRSFWPKYLFHVTHITNAVRIVADGVLHARNNVQDFHDIANQGALNNYAGSHDYARLYFRPRNGFHLRTEGIKCLSDPYRQESQASIPVAFVFKLEEVMTREGVKFTRGNIQRGYNVELDGDEEFKKLDFKAIYHDDYVTDENKEYIHDCRMAEVMVPGGLPLDGNLQAIIFRSNSDLETFRYYLQRQGVACNHRISVENVSGSLFMHMGLYISELNYIGDTLSTKFHFPSRNRPPGNRYKINICQQVPGKPDRIFDKSIELTAPTLRVKGFYPEASAIWVIYLEDVLAFEGPLAHLKSEVFG